MKADMSAGRDSRHSQTVASQALSLGTTMHHHREETAKSPGNTTCSLHFQTFTSLAQTLRSQIHSRNLHLRLTRSIKFVRLKKLILR